MRKALPIVIAALVALTGCRNEKKASEAQYFSTSDGLVELKFPAGWFKNPKENPFDLQCFSQDETETCGIFSFQMKDLASDTTPRMLLQLQIDDLRSKREHFDLVEPQTVAEEEGQTITAEVYSGEKDMGRYYYRFALIEFKENPDIVLVALQSAFPSQWDKDKPVLEGITRSARIKSAE